MATAPLTGSTLTCLCKRISIPLDELAKHTAFPLPAELCHCDTCRHSSGSMGAPLIFLKTAPAREVLDQCVKYSSSDKLSRYFCRNCGSHLFLQVYGTADKPDGYWLGWAGCIDRPDDAEFAEGKKGTGADVDTIKVMMQIYVDDTKDGGLCGRMLDVARQKEAASNIPPVAGNGTGPLATVFWDTWHGKPLSMTELEHRLAKSKPSHQGEMAQKLLAKCHCGGVQFHIARPDPSKKYDEKTQFYLKQDNTKYFVRLCCCRSCRTATGTPVDPNLYVPPENITTIDGEPIEFGSMTGLSQLGSAIKLYQSEVDEAVIRSFCGTCGATIFYEHHFRSWVVNISLGILRSDSGSMAEDFVEWSWNDCSFPEDGRVKEFYDALVGAS